MKNEYLEKICDRIQNRGGSRKKPAGAGLGVQAAGLSEVRPHLPGPSHLHRQGCGGHRTGAFLAGINELYITSQSSNQLDLWAVMDAFGLKLRGIGFIDNADYIVDVERWGSSNLPETLAALRFSFKEEQQ